LVSIVHFIAVYSVQNYSHVGIKGVDRRLTQGVLKRIIPAVASTKCSNSCVFTAKPIDNYLNFTDIEGVYCGVVKMEKDPDCPTCSGGYVQLQCNNEDTLQILIDKLVEKFHLKNPSIETVSEKLYMINDLLPELKDKSISNLLRPLRGILYMNNLYFFEQVSEIGGIFSRTKEGDGRRNQIDS
ncbi:E2 binding domain protein, partial [Cooperia oncophora]